MIPSRLKNKLRDLASTNHFFAMLVAVFYGGRGFLLRRRGSLEHVKSTVSMMTKSKRVLGRPMNITIEPTNACNLECPVCETGAGILERKQQHMSFETFKLIMDKVASHTNSLMFYFMGEPFLNKQAYTMIRYAKDLDIPFIDTCTNGDGVNPQKLIDCGIDRVSFQIGGMSQETHQIYRINSKLERVFKNMRETIRLKKLHHSPIKIHCGFILMKHNEHEVSLFLEKMAEYGVDQAQVIDPCVRTVEQAHTMLPTDKRHWIYDETALNQGIVKPKKLPNNGCPWIYYSLVIHASGNVVPCCRDPKGEEIMGNILFQSLDEIWNGEKYQEFRHRVRTQQGKINICKLCSSYPASAIN